MADVNGPLQRNWFENESLKLVILETFPQFRFIRSVADSEVIQF